jgi:hypothetical protein
MCFKSHIRKKKKQNRVSSGFARVPGQPTGSPGFGLAVATAGLLLNPGRSGPGSIGSRVDPPGRAGFNNSVLDQQRGVHVAFINDSTLFGFYFLFVFKKTLRKSRFRLWLLFPFKERRLHKSSYILIIHTCVFYYLKL